MKLYNNYKMGGKDIVSKCGAYEKSHTFSKIGVQTTHPFNLRMACIFSSQAWSGAGYVGGGNDGRLLRAMAVPSGRACVLN